MTNNLRDSNLFRYVYYLHLSINSAMISMYKDMKDFDLKVQSSILRLIRYDTCNK